MNPLLPFACPQCGLQSVSVGVCPECRLDLVRRDLAPARREEPEMPAQGVSVAPVFQGTSQDCARVAKVLGEASVPASVIPHRDEGRPTGLCHVVVPENWQERAEAVLADLWEREAQAQGLAPVTGDEALALEAEGLCPACRDPLLPSASECPSCGIALA